MVTDIVNNDALLCDYYFPKIIKQVKEIVANYKIIDKIIDFI